MVNDPDRDDRLPPDRDPAETGGPAQPADPWVMDAETILHRHDSGYPPAGYPDGGSDATQVAGARPADDATRMQPAAEPPHWVARANVNPAGPRSAMPRAWQEAETVDEPDPYGGRSWFTPVILGVVGLVLLFAIGIGVWLIYRNVGTPAQPGVSASAGVPTAAPTSAAPTTAGPTTVAPTPAEPTATGPVIAVIPTLRGVGQADATTQLTALGFHVVPVPVDDPTVAPGTVSRTDPPEGTPTTAGSTITIFVARQPTVPSSAPASAGASPSDR